MGMYAESAKLSEPSEDKRIVKEYLYRPLFAPVSEDERRRFKEAEARQNARTLRVLNLMFGIGSFQEAIKERPFRLADYAVFAWVACLIIVAGMAMANGLTSVDVSDDVGFNRPNNEINDSQ